MSVSDRYDRMREIVGRIKVLWDEQKKEEEKQAVFRKDVDLACAEVQTALSGAIHQIKVVAEHKKNSTEVFAYLESPSKAESLAFLEVSISENLSQEEVANKILKTIEDKLLQPILERKGKMLK